MPPAAISVVECALVVAVAAVMQAEPSLRTRACVYDLNKFAYETIVPEQFDEIHGSLE